MGLLWTLFRVAPNPATLAKKRNWAALVRLVLLRGNDQRTRKLRTDAARCLALCPHPTACKAVAESLRHGLIDDSEIDFRTFRWFGHSTEFARNKDKLVGEWDRRKHEFAPGMDREHWTYTAQRQIEMDWDGEAHSWAVSRLSDSDDASDQMRPASPEMPMDVQVAYRELETAWTGTDSYIRNQRIVDEWKAREEKAEAAWRWQQEVRRIDRLKREYRQQTAKVWKARIRDCQKQEKALSKIKMPWD